jgi:acyl carrier protein
VNDVDAIIRAVLDEHGRLLEKASTLDVNDDLYEAGLSSHASVNVMLALEDRFDIEFPEEFLRKSTFESIAAIRKALASTGVSEATD